MVVGYARAHMRDRDLRLQRTALRKASCDYIIEVGHFSVLAHRDGLRQVLDMLNSGDTLVVRRLERLATSLRELMAVSAILQERGIGLRVLEADPQNGADSRDVIADLLAALAKYARIKGMDRSGRPRGPNEVKREAALALSRDTTMSITEICKAVGISRQTYYRYKRLPEELLR